MLGTYNGALYVGVDNNTMLKPGSATGRNSVKLVSNSVYNSGLLIANFAHIPSNACGLWPAYWLVGPNWPTGGEIDIIEGVNMNADNQMTLHTNTGCTPSIGGAGRQTGVVAPNTETDCGAGNAAIGCGVVDPNGASYGSGFNTAGGGVYATLLSSSGIQIWMWNAGGVPGDVKNGAPNPSGWGEPVAAWGTGCNYGAAFSSMQIVSLYSLYPFYHSILLTWLWIINTAFCGAWAGNVWANTASPCAAGVATCNCASLASSCNTYVAENPSAFDEAYWLINSIQVYQ